MSARRNGVWSIAQAFAPAASSAIFAIVIARVLPVEQFGLFAYATSLVGIGVAVVTAGLNALAVREFVEHPKQHDAIVAALLVIREGFALAAYVILLVISLSGGSTAAIAATAVAGLALFARAADAPELWFVASYRARVPALIRVGAAGGWLAVKLAVAFSAPSLPVFLALFVIEPVTVAVLVVLAYLRQHDSPGLSRPSWSTARTLLKTARPLILSSAADQVNMRGDVVVIQAISGSASVALYSAAARLSEMTYLLPNAFMAGLFPRLVEIRRLHGEASQEYHHALERLFVRSFWLGAAVAGGTIAVSGWLVPMLYGDAYAASVDVLRIHVLAAPFAFMAAVSSKWLVAEGLLWASLKRHLAGAATNIALCLLLVPTIGIQGAAIATVVSYAISNYLSLFVGARTRPAALLMTKAMVWPAVLIRRSIVRLKVRR